MATINSAHTLYKLASCSLSKYSARLARSQSWKTPDPELRQDNIARREEEAGSEDMGTDFVLQTSDLRHFY